jgi:hypothetical protein
MAPYASVKPLNPFVIGVSPPKRIDEIGGVSGLFLIKNTADGSASRMRRDRVIRSASSWIDSYINITI